MAYIVKDKDIPSSCYSCYNSGCVHWETNSFKKFDDCPIIEISDEDCHMIETLKESGETVKGALSILTIYSILRFGDEQERKEFENVLKGVRNEMPI